MSIETTNHPSTIIILNGASSSGKTSIAEQLQKILKAPFLHIGISNFIKMLPPGYFDTRPNEGFYCQPTEEEYGTALSITIGPVAQKLLNGMRHAIAALADQQNNLIVEELLLNSNEIDEYGALLRPYTVYAIGVHAPLEVIEDREHKRSNRYPGSARGEYEIVHANKTYDLIIDTSTTSPEAAALLISNYITNNPQPKAFMHMTQK
jgi:chloramphenicol 3-O phosphotransferase